MKPSLNRRTSAVFAALCQSAYARNSTPSMAASNDFMTGAKAAARRLDLGRPNERQPHGANEWLVMQRGAA
ncbi:hypothetical protein NDK50_23500 [Paraburkholderia bryophila]|uniref:hypothetical protein n=1 Tax=Paraburkholderia bryophila TaxID=420952 RepID=UPI00234BDD48|nr:hypothetical protein [Paraburkholderia bryophila]WCM23817.1 hypothetical protein NDK50_23500 [Paraburkholderia bryophila]